MAQGDITFFEEALAYIQDGGWESTDTIKCAILDNTVTPTAGFATPALGDFTQVGSGGTYTAGGTSLGDLGTIVTEAAGVMMFDSGTNPTWAQNAGNDTDAYWALVYNDTDAGDAAILFLDLGGPVNMQAGDLTITWHANGLYRITIV